MNILHVALSGGWGGSEAIAFSISNDLARRGHNVAIAVKYNDIYSEIFYREKAANGVTIIDASTQTDDLISICPFVPQVVHGHLSPSFTRMRATKGNFVRVGHMHMRYYATQHRGLQCVYAVAPWQLRDVPRHFGGKASLIPNFTSAQVAHYDPSYRDEIRSKLNIPYDALVVGAAGRLNHDKGFDVLIEALRLLPRKNIHCIIAGAGADEERLLRAAEGLDNVHLIGFCNDVPKLLQTLDLYVSSSRADSFGLSLLEAMQVGLPVIATNTHGGEHLLGNCPDRVVKMEDPDELAYAIEKFVGLPAPLDSYRLDRFSLEGSVSLLEASYESLVLGLS